MPFTRRRLPHWIPERAIIFVTWRLYGSAPPIEPAILTAENTGRSRFRSYDERLDRADFGPVWLQDSRVAAMLARALLYGETVRQSYQLYAWVIMPNHVHVVFEPRAGMSGIMRWLKGRTSRRANQILGRVGLPFWQDESYDHWIRTSDELDEVIDYVEGNPVKAGLAVTEVQWPWSSARFKADDKNRSSAPLNLAPLI